MTVSTVLDIAMGVGLAWFLISALRRERRNRRAVSGEFRSTDVATFERRRKR